MQEIEFRGWNKKEKYMYHQRGLSLGTFFDHKVHPIDHWNIMQYTGLKDKHGVKIFEGDILKSEGVSDVFGIVIFKDGCFWFSWPEDYLHIWAIHSEVVGNICQNPELTKEENE